MHHISGKFFALPALFVLFVAREIIAGLCSSLLLSLFPTTFLAIDWPYCTAVIVSYDILTKLFPFELEEKKSSMID